MRLHQLLMLTESGTLLKVAKEVSVAAGPGGMAVVDRLDAACDATDERDEHFSGGGKLMMLI